MASIAVRSVTDEQPGARGAEPELIADNGPCVAVDVLTGGLIRWRSRTLREPLQARSVSVGLNHLAPGLCRRCCLESAVCSCRGALADPELLQALLSLLQEGIGIGARAGAAQDVGREGRARSAQAPDVQLLDRHHPRQIQQGSTHLLQGDVAGRGIEIDGHGLPQQAPGTGHHHQSDGQGGEGVEPEPADRAQSQWLPVSNGLAIWQPVRVRERPGQPPVLHGYVSVALGSLASDQELEGLRQGLLIVSLLAGLLTFVGRQSMVAVSLRPIRRQIEQLVRFTADASHELRQPLTAIRAVIGSLHHGEALVGAQPLVLEKLALIDGASERMGKLVDDLLLLTRFDRAIKDHSGRRDFPLDELVEDQCRLFQDSAAAQGVSLVADIGDPATVFGHPERLRRLLANLISNALRFSAAGDTVLIGLKVQGAFVQLWVDDQGPGIPAAQRDQVFQRFWQADRSRSSASHGGLGLEIARAIAQAHGGRLVAREAPGGGARLLLELPLKA